MNNLTVAPAANDDLKQIWSYLSGRNIHAANHMIQLIHRKCLQLASMPTLGSMCDNFQSGLRYASVRKHYVIYYRITSNGIEVARILHGARDCVQLLQ